MNATRLLTATTFLLAFGHSAVAQTAAATPSQFGVTAPMRQAAPDLSLSAETLQQEGVGLERKVPAGRLLASGKQTVERLAQNQAPTSSPPSTRATGKSWVKRHPVLTGAFVGGAIGGALGATACPSNGDCTGWTGIYTAVGAGEGFGFGALAGWLLSR
jgi:hypothetical protein